jgi:pyruvate formate lyase activating enzyme
MSLPIIRGFNHTSEIGKDVFSPSIFLEGCNLRCPFCMNSRLVTGKVESKVDILEVKNFVIQNKSEWLMIGGGEPTCILLDSLIELLKEIKSWGCKIGISTNGVNHDVLINIMNYLNYVALDFKSPDPDCYDKISTVPNSYRNMLSSRGFLESTQKFSKDFDYEIRTTLYPPFINQESLKKIGKFINRQDKWFLQQFRCNKNMIDENCKNIQPYSDEQIEKLLSIAKEYCDNVFLRYV